MADIIDHALHAIADREADFRKRWSPNDPYERERFNHDLAMLIHTIYREAGRPYIEHLAKILGAMPVMPITIKKDNLE